MPDKDVVKSKLSAMSSYFEQLMPFVERYRKGGLALDSQDVLVIERLFQLLVDTAIDINTHIITRSGLESPDDYEGTFRVLGKNNVIPLELGERISGSVALRNRMVHGYETVQRKRMLDDISGGINQYAEYMKHISAFVEKQNK
ncbi:MAG: hypothetical protein A2W52_01580 [Candidatus Taylorbacteria bacterium RIFCSPHIGHO2_02_49_25]|uniref:DUF86 domain-containing protein n=1 Tax=Candidatus Taylorbacteria bacterium RIFCSPHIGHO2_02_49_25 TaxID=1802305 RepID=A0A1G2MB44_9BACT|nr:MAG: hypothetical protein UY62_C0038G0002 [Parcubacteria group bacterium GW2011_GWF2_50_9]OHA21033.1 MAG: hypothetical protein A2W52_01580 [Candidatus Taylorbacteria bacterium RIFCSPHIGHO2_02_49_25]OHA37439.1 MAG: hypothetical protein A2W65_03690 [Candidatus Taylorbacteria bacterium RIFCSPLOWO2_02_50_13]HCB35378.1 hypothetical protein [Candidatus Taylorbacteria bacterium]